MFLFSTGRYTYLAERLADVMRRPLGRIERKTFPDGELYHRIDEDVDGQHAVLVGGTISEGDSLELFDMACGLVRGGADLLTLVVPYFGYATMDRAVRRGEIVKAKTRARLLSSIPRARQANRVILLDLHAEGIQYYFEGGLQAVHVYAKPVIIEAIGALGGKDFVLASTDAGRAKWVESLANELGVPANFIFKRRLADGTPVVSAMNAAVEGRRVVIYDDMIRSGETLLAAAQAYRQCGAAAISCVATHGVFPGDSLGVIERSRLVDRIICTNSHPRAVELAGGHAEFLQAYSIAGIFQEILEHSGREPS
jgi:ribose-phosphate pyrophosphokinase